MNGAEALIRTLVGAEVDVCFANPGTSEMHFVAAVDRVPEMRVVLGLFEGVVTGAADGYARMTRKPAATLLHLGPGMANGMANLHNARRARVPVVNIVGDHATYHKVFDAPLESDIESAASTFSSWIGRPTGVENLAALTAHAVAAATGPPAGIATLILPADVSWTEGAQPSAPQPHTAGRQVPEDVVKDIARALTSSSATLLLLGGLATSEQALIAASRISNRTGSKVLTEVFPTRVARGAGVPPVGRLPYLAERASEQLAGLEHIVLVDAKSPVAFFAYPDKPSNLVPDGCRVHVLATDADDVEGALESLADIVAARTEPTLAPEKRPEIPTGRLTGRTVCDVVGALLPDGAILVDEGATSGIWALKSTGGSPRHDWLTVTGGAIGSGLPLALGAAVACPDRPVINLQADGSAMYTIQALWTMAREGLDVTTILLNNRSYAILNMELQRVGAEPGPKALDMLDLSRPDIGFASIAHGMGVDACTPTDIPELVAQLERAMREPGPHLIEVLVDPGS